MPVGDTLKLLSRGFKSESAEETFALGASFAETLRSGAFVALSGDLGAGKTAFAKGMAAGLGVSCAVKSPSFNICCIYDGAGGVKFVHIDAYRLSGAEAFEDLLVEEIAPEPRIICVEWPEKIAGAIPEDAIEIRFEILEDASHFIKFAD